jgi:hypothetical protein
MFRDVPRPGNKVEHFTREEPQSAELDAVISPILRKTPLLGNNKHAPGRGTTIACCVDG